LKVDRERRNRTRAIAGDQQQKQREARSIGKRVGGLEVIIPGDGEIVQKEKAGPMWAPAHMLLRALSES
jgi:hypothetical protein